MATRMNISSSQKRFNPMHRLIKHPSHNPVQVRSLLNVESHPETVIGVGLLLVRNPRGHEVVSEFWYRECITRHQFGNLTPFSINDMEVYLLDWWIFRTGEQIDDILLLIFLVDLR